MTQKNIIHHVQIFFQKQKGTLAAICVAAMLIVIQGLYFIRTVGPLTLPDPGMHVLGSYALATGQSFNPTIKTLDEYGNERSTQILTGDASYLDLPEVTNALISTIIGNGDLTALHDSQKELQKSISEQKQGTTYTLPYDEGSTESTTSFNRATQYFPLSWLPSAIGVKCGLILNLDGYSAYQLGRISNLMIFLGLTSLSIALIPKMKSILVLLASFPTTVFCASSLMSDAFIIGLCMLSVSLTLRCIAKESFSVLELGVVSGLAAMITVVKASYLPICLGYLLCSKKTLSTKRKIYATIPIILAIIIYMVWNHIYGDLIATANMHDNAVYLFQHPVQGIVRILLAIALLPSLLSQMSGAYIFPIMLGCLITFAHIFNSKNNVQTTLSKRFVYGAGLAAFASLVLIFLFLLVSWNNTNSESALTWILGFQGRYLLPIVPLVCYVQTLNGPFSKLEKSQ